MGRKIPTCYTPESGLIAQPRKIRVWRINSAVLDAVFWPRGISQISLFFFLSFFFFFLQTCLLSCSTCQVLVYKAPAAPHRKAALAAQLHQEPWQEGTAKGEGLELSNASPPWRPSLFTSVSALHPSSLLPSWVYYPDDPNLQDVNTFGSGFHQVLLCVKSVMSRAGVL